MRREEIDPKLAEASFEFFYWYSRFEFALKESGFLKNEQVGATAEPDWEKFREKFKGTYKASPSAAKLITMHPKKQVVEAGSSLSWKPVGIDHCNTDLCKLVTMLSAVRNNLFHGGKHGDNEVDDLKRNIDLLEASRVVLNELAAFAGFEADYTRYY